MQSVIDKFHPTRFRTSGKMTAILDAMLGHPGADRWTFPIMEGFAVTSDNFVVQLNGFVGGLEEFEANLKGCCDAAQLTDAERIWFAQQVNEHIEWHSKDRVVL